MGYILDKKKLMHLPKTHLGYIRANERLSKNFGQDVCTSGRDGEFCGRGDEGRPIILECRFPRSEVVTETFRPRLAATWDAFDVFEAVGVSGGVTRMAGSGPRFVTLWIGLGGDDDSMVTSPSVVSVPLSS